MPAEPNAAAVNDKAIINALLQYGATEAAAEAAGTTPAIIQDRMNDKKFMAAYKAAKNDIIRKAVISVMESYTQ